MTRYQPRTGYLWSPFSCIVTIEVKRFGFDRPASSPNALPADMLLHSITGLHAKANQRPTEMAKSSGFRDRHLPRWPVADVETIERQRRRPVSLQISSPAASPGLLTCGPSALGHRYRSTSGFMKSLLGGLIDCNQSRCDTDEAMFTATIGEAGEHDETD